MAALATAANEARGLAMDSIAAAHSGHMGLPLGAAEIGASLYGSQVRSHRTSCRNMQSMGHGVNSCTYLRTDAAVKWPFMIFDDTLFLTWSPPPRDRCNTTPVTPLG
jgi:hypothetical protein